MTSPAAPAPILPGATIGILGSGQLGRMLTIAAKQMGYSVSIYSPDKDSPAGQVADREVVGAYEDLNAVRAFAQSVDVVTFEFENVPSATSVLKVSTARSQPTLSTGSLEVLPFAVSWFPGALNKGIFSLPKNDRW